MRTFSKTRLVMALAYLLCTVMFLIQLISLLPSYVSPTRTHTEVKEVPLKTKSIFVSLLPSMPAPLSSLDMMTCFTICLGWANTTHI